MKLRRWMQEKLGRTIVVHLKDGPSVQGSLLESGEDYIVLHGAEISAGDAKAPAQGELVIGRERILLMQVLRVTPSE